MALLSGPTTGSFIRHPKTNALYRLEPTWRDHKGRPSIVFPMGLGKERVKTDIEYEFMVEETRRYYVLTVDGRSKSHRVIQARKFAIDGVPIVSDEEWERWKD